MEITSEELKTKIENGEKVVVDFYTDWCNPCRLMKPTFDKISEEYRSQNSEVQLYTMNVEHNKDIAMSLGIRSVPTIKSFSNGEEKYTQSGLHQENQIKLIIDNLING